MSVIDSISYEDNRYTKHASIWYNKKPYTNKQTACTKEQILSKLIELTIMWYNELTQRRRHIIITLFQTI